MKVDIERFRLTRRTFNMYMIATATAAIPLLLSACGDDDEPTDDQENVDPTSETSEVTEETSTSESESETDAETEAPESGSDSSLEQLVVAVAENISTLNPIQEPTTTSSELNQSFENLVLLDENLEIQPGLAISWEMNDDTKWDFTLRDGVTFHNGEALTIDDVVWSYTTMLESGAESGPRKDFAAWLESVEVVDESTIRLNSMGPYPSVLPPCTNPLIIPQAHFESVGPEGFNKEPVGTGPYQITSWSLNQELTLERFDDYWGEVGEIPKAAFRILPEESTRINELVTGGVHIVLNLSPSRVVDLEGESNVSLTTAPSVVNFWLGFNTNLEPFNDVKVRKAIAHAIDVPLIVQEVLGGYAEPANSLVNQPSFGWDPNAAKYEYDPELAKSLLEEAGFGDGFKADFQCGPGVWPATKESGEAISGFLSQVGIEAPFQLLEWGTYFELYRSGKLNGLFLWGHSAPELDAQIQLQLNFHSPPGGRGIYWSSPELDALIEDAQVDLDPDSRLRTFEAAQKLMHDEAGAVPLWDFEEIAAISNLIDWNARGTFTVDIARVKLA